MRRVSVSLVLCLSGFGAVMVPADAAATVVTCNFPVFTSIVVANSLSNCGQDGLRVMANDVTINLNDMRIDGDDADSGGSDAGIDNSLAFSGLRVIGPGTISDFEEGIEIGSGTAIRNRINGVVIQSNTRNGVSVTEVSGVALRRNAISGNTLNGIDVAGVSSDVTIDKNRVAHNGSNGIDLSGTVQRATISGNRSFANGARGLNVSAGTGHVVTGNRFSGNGDIGINLGGAVQGALIRGNLLSANTTEGINVPGGTGQRIIDNRVVGNGFQGINVAGGSGHRIRNNNVSGNLRNGINLFLGDAVVLVSNVANRNGYDNGVDDNTGLGIFVGGGVTDLLAANNRARGNADDAQSSAAANCN